MRGFFSVQGASCDIGGGGGGNVLFRGGGDLNVFNGHLRPVQDDAHYSIHFEGGKEKVYPGVVVKAQGGGGLLDDNKEVYKMTQNGEATNEVNF